MLTFSPYEVFCYLSSFLGLALSVVLITNDKGDRNVRWSLVFYLWLNSLIVLLGSIHYSGKIEFFPVLFRVDSPLHYLFGPLGYFYILASVNRNFKFRYSHLIHALPFLINTIELSPVYLLDKDQKIDQYVRLMSSGTVVMPLNYILKNVSGFLYLCAGSYKVYQSISKFDTKSTDKRYLFNWLILFLFWQFLLVLGLTIESISGLSLFDDPYRFGISMVSLFLLGSTTTLLFFPQIIYNVNHEKKKPNSRYHHSNLSEENKNKIFISLQTFMNSESNPFLDKDLTLGKLANALSVNSQQLSQVINEKTGMNYNDFINMHRIEYVKGILISPEYQKFTLSAISYHSGFQSKTTFYTAFKKFTGFTPKEFILNHQEK